MKQTMKYLSIAALVAVGAIMMGCNKLDIVTEQTQQEEEPVISNTVTLTTTVSLDAATKALTSGGVKTFAVAEQMALVYKNTSGTTVKAVSAALTAGDIASGSKTATFTFELTDPDKAQNVTYIYPAAMAKADGTVNYDALATQNGTLATLSSSLDLATKTSAWNAGSLPAATLENQLVILALTLKNSTGSSDITSSITGLTLSDGTKTYNVAREAVAGPIYVAIYPTADATIMVTATDGTKNYTKTLTGKTYAKGNGYSVSWRMTAPAPAETTVTWTASDMEYLILDLGVTSGNVIKGITVTGSGLDMNSWKGTKIEVQDGNATFTFTSSVGNIKSIVITAENINMSEVPSGWTLDDMSSPNTLTWSGTPSATVSLHFEEWQQSIENISTIEFTVVQ